MALQNISGLVCDSQGQAFSAGHTPMSSRFDRSALSPLKGSFSGRLLLPGDEGYETARRVHNGLIDRHPTIIACCSRTADVLDALEFAIQHDLEIAVRGGGHNVAGRAVIDEGLMIDLSPMKGICLDPIARSVRVQAGVTWGEFNQETQLHALATTGGAVSSTGVAGLTLGGGFGFLMGKHGYTIDNLTAVELVTAQGQLLRASKEENSELFWGVCGGGGNFGIATSFEFMLNPIGPMVYGGMIAYPNNQSKDMLRFYRELSSAAPDELTVAAGLTHGLDGQQVAAMLVCHCGPDDEATAALHSIKAFGTPLLDRLGPLSYTSLNQMLDSSFPKLALNYWKSCFLSELSDDVITVLREQFARCPSPMSKLILEHFHGAALLPKPTDMAFPHRDPGYSVLIIAQWSDPKANRPNIAWSKETFAALQPFTRQGAYSNYMADDEPLSGVKRAFGENFPRLQKLKDLYDPGNLFRNNQNIPPTKLCCGLGVSV
jgi:FAD binding domain-containing protein/berberine-like enzyme